MWIYGNTHVISYICENGFILKTTKDKVVDAECFHFHNINLQGYDWIYKYMLMYANDINEHMIT